MVALKPNPIFPLLIGLTSLLLWAPAPCLGSEALGWSGSSWRPTVLTAADTAARQRHEPDQEALMNAMEEQLEGLDMDDPDFNIEAYTQILQDMARNPVNINRARAGELARVPGLDLIRAGAIVRYREEVKPFESVDELAEVEGIGKATVDKIRAYVTAGEGGALRRDLWTDHRYWTHNSRATYFSRYQTRLETPLGYRLPDSGRGYLGSRTHYYQRFHYRSDHVSMNLTQDKDPGEPLGSPAGFDFNSAHLAIENAGRLQTLVLGDYSLGFGQGLLLGGSGGFGKGALVVDAPQASERGVRPYTSAMESGYWRGAAFMYGGRFQAGGFYSSAGRTASTISADTVRFPSSSGYHRTATERARKNNLSEQLWGGRLRMVTDWGSIGASGYRVAFGKTIGTGGGLHALHDFTGDEHTATSVDYRLFLGRLDIYGESVRSRNGAYGLINGLTLPFENSTALTVAHRYYQKDLQSPYGQGFGGSAGGPANQQGYYVGVRHHPASWLELKGYFDQYRYPAPRYGESRSTTGYDWLLRADVTAGRGVSGYVMARSKRRDTGYGALDEWGRQIERMGHTARTSYRAHLEYALNSRFRLRTRGELVLSRAPEGAGESGYLMYQDLRYKWSDKLSFDGRVTFFQTESYASRVYLFENDMLYVFSIPALYGQGQRMYLLVNYEPRDWLEFWAKYSISIYDDRNQIGSGLDVIAGDQKRKVGIQMRIRF